MRQEPLCEEVKEGDGPQHEITPSGIDERRAAGKIEGAEISGEQQGSVMKDGREQWRAAGSAMGEQKTAENGREHRGGIFAKRSLAT